MRMCLWALDQRLGSPVQMCGVSIGPKVQMCGVSIGPNVQMCGVSIGPKVQMSWLEDSHLCQILGSMEVLAA
jgi:hypothetical protein